MKRFHVKRENDSNAYATCRPAFFENDTPGFHLLPGFSLFWIVAEIIVLFWASPAMFSAISSNLDAHYSLGLPLSAPASPRLLNRALWLVNLDVD